MNHILRQIRLLIGTLAFGIFMLAYADDLSVDALISLRRIIQEMKKK
jgi:hypothetical protein